MNVQLPKQNLESRIKARSQHLGLNGNGSDQDHYSKVLNGNGNGKHLRKSNGVNGAHNGNGNGHKHLHRDHPINRQNPYSFEAVEPKDKPKSNIVIRFFRAIFHIIFVDILGFR